MPSFPNSTRLKCHDFICLWIFRIYFTTTYPFLTCAKEAPWKEYLYFIYTYTQHTHSCVYIHVAYSHTHLVLVPSETLEERYFVYDLQYSDLGSTAPEPPGLLVRSQIAEFQPRWCQLNRQDGRWIWILYKKTSQVVLTAPGSLGAPTQILYQEGKRFKKENKNLILRFFLDHLSSFCLGLHTWRNNIMGWPTNQGTRMVSSLYVWKYSIGNKAPKTVKFLYGDQW